MKMSICHLPTEWKPYLYNVWFISCVHVSDVEEAHTGSHSVAYTCCSVMWQKGSGFHLQWCDVADSQWLTLAVVWCGRQAVWLTPAMVWCGCHGVMWQTGGVAYTCHGVMWQTGGVAYTCHCVMWQTGGVAYTCHGVMWQTGGMACTCRSVMW